MKIFEIIDGESSLLMGVLMYYEKEKSYIIELPEGLDEWNAPLLFTSFVRRRIYTIPKDISFLWVQERVIPSGRQNISDILNKHHLQFYDEMKFLEISQGKCSQDSLYIKQTDSLPDFVLKRQTHNIRESVFLENYEVLCFFLDDTIRKISLKKLCMKSGLSAPSNLDEIDLSEKLENIENIDVCDDLNKITNNEMLYRTGKVGTGGYSITFNNTIDIPAWVLYNAGIKIDLRLKDFIAFVQNNTLDTAECCDILECSRQNISYMVRQHQLTPTKKEVRGNLYLKGNVLGNLW